MEINKLSADGAGEFQKALRHLIQTTISLPATAIEYFSNQWSEEKIKNSAESWVFLTAKEDNTITGIVLGTPVEGGVGTIIWLLVDTQNQKHGLGSRLFNVACDLYREKGAHKIKLTVPDEATTKFYLKQGMVLEGIHQNHWWNADFWAMGIQL